MRVRPRIMNGDWAAVVSEISSKRILRTWAESIPSLTRITSPSQKPAFQDEQFDWQELLVTSVMRLACGCIYLNLMK